MSIGTKPTKLKYNDEQIRKAAKRPSLPFGWHFFVIANAETRVAEKEKTLGNMTVNAECYALKEPSDADSKVRPKMFNSFTLPYDNPDMPGHKAPEWAPGLCAQFLRACFEEEIPEMPAKNAEGVLIFDGKEISPDDEEESRQEVMRKVYDKAAEIWADPTVLVGKAFYGEVGKDKKTGQYVNILNMRPELPEGQVLVDLSAAPTSATDEAEKPASKKPAPKKGKK